MKTLERKYTKTERIVAKAKFSAWVYLKPLIFTAILGAIVAVIWVFAPKIESLFANGETIVEPKYLTDENMRWVLLGAGIASILAFLLQALSLNTKEFIVTEENVVFRKGALSIQSTVIPLIEIRIIENAQNPIQRLFCTGTLVIVSDAEQPYRIKGVKSADRLMRKITAQVSLAKNKLETKRIQVTLA